MPTVANGINFVWNLRQAHGENLERELRRSLLPKRQVIGLKRERPFGTGLAAISSEAVSDVCAPSASDLACLDA